MRRVSGRGLLLGLHLGRAGGRGAAGAVRAPDPHRHRDRSRRCSGCCRRSRSLRRRPTSSSPDSRTCCSEQTRLPGPGGLEPGGGRGAAGAGRPDQAGRDQRRPGEEGPGHGVHGPQPPHPHQLRDRDVPPRRARGGAGAGEGQLDAGNRAGRGDGRELGRAHRRCRPGAGPLRRCAGRPHLSPGRRLGGRAEGRDHPELRPPLREAGDQSGVGPAASLPGTGRRDDAAGEAGPGRGQAVRAHLGLAPQGASHGGARQRRARGGPAGHGDRDRPARGLRAGSGGHRADPASWPSRRAASSCTSSTTPTRRWSAPMRCT